MKRVFDSGKFKKLLLKGEVSEKDFRSMYPLQSVSAVTRTARYYMKPLEVLGVAVKKNGRWVIRQDVIRSIERFEELRRKIGFEGDLFEFISLIFAKTRELWRKKTIVELLAQEHGTDEEVLVELLEEILRKEDPKVFLEEMRSGVLVKIEKEVLERLEEENKGAVRELGKRGYAKEEALNVILNSLLKEIPLSLELWSKVKEDSPSSVEVWILDRLAERKKPDGVELVPVSKKLYSALQKAVEGLNERDRYTVMERLAKRLNSAVEKTLKEAKMLKRRRET